VYGVASGSVLRKTRAVNLPNQLSLGRLVLTVPFVATFCLPIPYARSWALLIFIVASITDLADGIIARSRGLVTNFGKLVDPLADKVLMTGALVLLAAEDVVPAWIVILILAREFIVTGIRQIAVAQGVVLAAEKLGKHKMVWQVITVIYFLAHAASQEALLAFTAPLFKVWALSPSVLGLLCIWVTTLLTVVSGWRYFWLNRRLFSDA
jgi:CDP-diacylglycerol---glycerol-3-phosphate 3-phosphatidyltransferase